jgi:signal peptidase I
VFHARDDKTKLYVKRVVGVPGDRVVIKDGSVKVFNDEFPDGFNPDGDYIPPAVKTESDQPIDEEIKPGHMFVLGDNRTELNSLDSRIFGQVETERIIGKATAVLLPRDQFQIL